MHPRLITALLCLAALALGARVFTRRSDPAEMLGGFSKVDPAKNDEGVEQARAAVAQKIEGKLGSSVKVEVLEAHSQVVAGTNYKLKVKASDAKVEAKYYEAQVWAKLPAHGGAFEVTRLDEISAEQAGASGKGEQESPQDMDVEDAAAYAVQQLSQSSNSLAPFVLKKVLSAQRVPGSNGGGGATHTLRLLVAQGSQAEQVFEVEVGMDAQGHRMKGSKQISREG